MTSYDLGPESLLGVAEGETAQELRNRLDLALRYIANWYRATDDSEGKVIWWVRIDQTRALVEEAFRLCNPADIFPGRDGVAAYNAASASFAELWRALTLSADTLPRRDLIDIAADYFDAVVETPGYLTKKITNTITEGIGGALGAALGNLWPWLLLAGAAWAIWTFRAPLSRAIGKVA